MRIAAALGAAMAAFAVPAVARRGRRRADRARALSCRHRRLLGLPYARRAARDSPDMKRYLGGSDVGFSIPGAGRVRRRRT